MIYCAHTVKLRSIWKFAPRSPMKDNIESLVGTGSSSPYISLSRSCSFSDTAAASFHYWITSKLYHIRRQKRPSYPYECLGDSIIFINPPSNYPTFCTLAFPKIPFIRLPHLQEMLCFNIFNSPPQTGQIERTELISKCKSSFIKDVMPLFKSFDARYCLVQKEQLAPVAE